MEKNLTHVCCVALLLFIAGCGGSSDSTSVDAAGKHNEKLLETTGKSEEAGWFVAEMTSSNMLEAELGRLASSKATNPQIQQLGQLLLNHHKQLNTQLKQIADLKNLITPTSLKDDHQDAYTSIMEKSGAEFDKAYLDATVENHKETIDQFTEMSEQGQDTEIKNFATKALPTLKAHLTQAETLQDQLGS